MAQNDVQQLIKAIGKLTEAVKEESQAIKYTNALLRKQLLEKEGAARVEEPEEPSSADVVRERVRSINGSIQAIAGSLDHLVDGGSEESTDA